MGLFRIERILMVASLLLGATIALSCKDNKVIAEVDKNTLITQESDNLVILSSLNGKLRYRFETPRLESYELAAEPYTEFIEGVKVITYDTAGRMESQLVADYAKRLERAKLWEARGNVIATNSKGETLETEQLFWDEKTDRIYSNVLSKITIGEDVVIGTSFESNTKFDDYVFRNPEGQVTVDTSPKTGEDSVSVSSPAAPPAPAYASPNVLINNPDGTVNTQQPARKQSEPLPIVKPVGATW